MQRGRVSSNQSWYEDRQITHHFFFSFHIFVYLKYSMMRGFCFSQLISFYSFSSWRWLNGPKNSACNVGMGSLHFTFMFAIFFVSPLLFLKWMYVWTALSPLSDAGGQPPWISAISLNKLYLEIGLFIFLNKNLAASWQLYSFFADFAMRPVPIAVFQKHLAWQNANEH